MVTKVIFEKNGPSSPIDQIADGIKHRWALTYFTYLALQPVFGLGLITKVTPFLSIPR
jgi:hypothetical protein